MRPSTLDRLPLRCPSCLKTTDAQRHAAARLELSQVDRETPAGIEQGTLVCRAPACGRRFPILDGVPILVDDLHRYLSVERHAILRRRDLPAWAETLLDLPLSADDPERAAQSIANAYDVAHHDPAPAELADLARPFRAFVEEALDRHGPPPSGESLGLDVGCAAGGFTALLARHVGTAAGLELRFPLARTARERVGVEPTAPAFLAADAESPPFPDAAVDVVLALNLIDSVPRPSRILAALDRLLRPGGLLVVTTPFAYLETLTPLAEQLDERELLARLTEGGLGYQILEDHPRVPWHVPGGERRHHVFLVRALGLRKADT